MSRKPCLDCELKKPCGRICEPYKVWLLDESPPQPILNLPKIEYKMFNITPRYNEPDAQSSGRDRARIVPKLRRPNRNYAPKYMES
jgi:hypothetical protein